MSDSSIYNLLNKMEADNIVFAYNGEIDKDLLEAVYSMMDKYLEEKKVANDIRKKFFHILIESLQNVFHHQSTDHNIRKENILTGFAIKSKNENGFEIITGNYIQNSGVEKLKERIEKVNGLSSEDLKSYYQQSLASNEFSEKGGAGLGIIEMARKSGKKLVYDFTKINEMYSFFSLTISIP